MKILLNASTINIGGGLFVSVNFIKESLKDRNNEINWFYVLSNEVKKELDNINVKLPVDKVFISKVSPAKLLRHFKSVNHIKSIEREVNPDIIYSIGSPSYINFKNSEVQRLANGLITHINSETLNSYNFLSKYKLLIKSCIQQKIISRSRYFITQTETAKKGILKITKEEKNTVKVIPNTISDTFIENGDQSPKSEGNYIFCLASPYPHKNIHKIPRVANNLKRMGTNNFKFVLTVPKDNSIFDKVKELSAKFEVSEHILNVGKLTQPQCVEWYNKSEIVFLPTYLETFSATLLEALYMRVPIVTTDFNFNKDVCGKYASYFQPEDWNGAAQKIKYLLENKVSRETILMSTEEYKIKFKNFRENYEETISFLNEVYQKKNKESHKVC